MTLTERDAIHTSVEHRYIEGTSIAHHGRYFICIDCGKELWLPHEDDSAPPDTGRERGHGPE